MSLDLSPVAKISDLGVAKIVKADSKATKSIIQLTKAPGTADFMPPECLVDNPMYDTSLDVFSFAGIMLHVINQEWPTPTIQVSLDPQTGDLIARNEVERRQVYIDKIKGIDRAKVLQPLIKECLQNLASKRPLISDLLKRLEQLSVRSNYVILNPKRDNTSSGNVEPTPRVHRSTINSTSSDKKSSPPPPSRISISMKNSLPPPPPPSGRASAVPPPPLPSSRLQSPIRSSFYCDDVFLSALSSTLSSTLPTRPSSIDDSVTKALSGRYRFRSESSPPPLSPSRHSSSSLPSNTTQRGAKPLLSSRHSQPIITASLEKKALEGSTMVQWDNSLQKSSFVNQMQMPPPPPPAPPPPTLALANTNKPKLNKQEQKDRGALLGDIHKGMRLKKVQTNDRSGPVLDKPKSSGGGGGGPMVPGGGGGMAGGLFAGGMPKLRPSSGNRPGNTGGHSPVGNQSGGGPTPFNCPGGSPPPPVNRPGLGSPGVRSPVPNYTSHRMPMPGGPRANQSSDAVSRPPPSSRNPPSVRPPPVPGTARPGPPTPSRGPPSVPPPSMPAANRPRPPPPSRSSSATAGPSPVSSIQSRPLPIPPGSEPTVNGASNRPPPIPSGSSRPQHSSTRSQPPPPPPSRSVAPPPPPPNRLQESVRGSSSSGNVAPPPPPPNRMPPSGRNSSSGNLPPVRNTSSGNVPALGSPSLPTRQPQSYQPPPPPNRDPPAPPPSGAKDVSRRAPPPPSSTRHSQPPPPVPSPNHTKGRGAPPPPPSHKASTSSVVSEFESRFTFDDNLPEPEAWRPGPKTYPSQNVKQKQGGGGRHSGGPPPPPPTSGGGGSRPPPPPPSRGHLAPPPPPRST